MVGFFVDLKTPYKFQHLDTVFQCGYRQMYATCVAENVVDHNDSVLFSHQVSDAEDKCWEQT